MFRLLSTVFHILCFCSSFQGQSEQIICFHLNLSLASCFVTPIVCMSSSTISTNLLCGLPVCFLVFIYALYSTISSQVVASVIQNFGFANRHINYRYNFAIPMLQVCCDHIVKCSNMRLCVGISISVKLDISIVRFPF